MQRTAFKGYEGLESEGRVVALLKGGSPVNELRNGEEGEVVLDRTPFYAEAGGQVGDTGTLASAGVTLPRTRHASSAARRMRTWDACRKGPFASGMSSRRRWMESVAGLLR